MTPWERIFQIFFPGGFLTIEYGIIFAAIGIAVMILTELLQKRANSKSAPPQKRIAHMILLIFCSVFSPVVLGFLLGFKFLENLFDMKREKLENHTHKIAIIATNIFGICLVIGVGFIFVYFFRLVFSYLILIGFFVGGLLSIIPYTKEKITPFWTNLLNNQNKRVMVTGIMVLICLLSLFLTTGFIRPTYHPPESYSSSTPSSLTVVTYNIRQGIAIEKDPLDNWKERKDDLAQYIDTLGADFVLVQEAFRFQIQYLTQNLVNRTYGYTGNGREDDTTGGEHSAILFDSNKFSFETGGTFWFSNTPYYPSRSWGGKYPSDRICSWALFEDVNLGNQFIIASVHYGFGKEFDTKASQLLNTRLAQIAGPLPVIVGGDFNMNSSMPGFESLVDYGEKPLQSSYDEIHGPGPHLIDTFNRFDLTYDHPTNKIDFIFMSANVAVLSCEVLEDTYTAPDGHQHYFSDHFPVRMTCEV